MAESLEFTIQLPVYPERVYRAWLSAGEYRAFTGQAAHIDARAGGTFTLMDGQVRGTFETLTPYDHIVQTWHMADFPPNAESKVELLLEPTCTGTELKVRHTGIPAGQARKTLEWWESACLRPLSRYFEEIVGEYTADMGDG